MRPRGSAAQLEYRRRLAGGLLQQGKGVCAVARLGGAALSSVHRRKEVIKRSGMEALVAKSHPGRRPRLSARQKEELVELVLRGPLATGYLTHLWICRWVAEVIEKHFGVTCYREHVWRMRAAVLSNRLRMASAEADLGCVLKQRRACDQEVAGQRRKAHWRETDDSSTDRRRGWILSWST